MSQNTLIRIALFIALGALAGCSDAQEKVCQNPDLHCYIGADGQATCEDGYTWEDATDPNNFQCVPVGGTTGGGTSGGSTGDTTGGTSDGSSGTGGGSTGGDSSGDDSTADDGCPPNSSLEDDGYCYCDEGFVVNEDASACVEDDGSGSGGGQSQGNCPPNSYEQDGSCYCNDGYVVNQDRNACVPACENDAACGADEICLEGGCEPAPCTPGSCGTGLVCDEGSGNCIPDLGTLPPTPNLDCEPVSLQECSFTDTDCVPSWSCSGNYCGELGIFEPRLGNHYWDYPLNGETNSDQYRSFIRGDVQNAVRYATAKVRCMSQNWTFGNGMELGLGDMSEGNGDIPGTRENSPGHPQGTHVNGHDMDIAYYQLSASDNRLRSVCEHTINGQDQYHCTEPPHDLDVWRNAIFLAAMHDVPNLRVIGVDGQIGPLVESAIDQMCTAGWITGRACTSSRALAYETTDNGYGWYRFHHHHLHISLSGSKDAITSMCLTEDCRATRHNIGPMLKFRPLRDR